MNLNQLAVEISKREGGKINLSIAQIKEVIGHFCDIVVDEVDKDMLYKKINDTGKRRIKKRKKKNG